MARAPGWSSTVSGFFGALEAASPPSRAMSTPSRSGRTARSSAAASTARPWRLGRISKSTKRRLLGLPTASSAEDGTTAIRSPSRSSQPAAPARGSGTATATCPVWLGRRTGSREALGLRPSPAESSQAGPFGLTTAPRSRSFPGGIAKRRIVRGPERTGSPSARSPVAPGGGTAMESPVSKARKATPPRSNSAAAGRRAKGKTRPEPAGLVGAASAAGTGAGAGAGFGAVFTGAGVAAASFGAGRSSGSGASGTRTSEVLRGGAALRNTSIV